MIPRGYRNFFLVALDIITSSVLVWTGIRAGVDLVSLSTVLGVKSGGLIGAIFGRGYNKSQEAKNGGIQ